MGPLIDRALSLFFCARGYREPYLVYFTAGPLCAAVFQLRLFTALTWKAFKLQRGALPLPHLPPGLLPRAHSAQPKHEGFVRHPAR